MGKLQDKIKQVTNLRFNLKRSNLAAYIDAFLSLKTPEVALIKLKSE